MSREEERKRRGIYTGDETAEYAKFKHIVPGTVLWSLNIELSEDVFRSGGKNNPAVDYLRWKDIGYDDKEGRLTDAALDSETISPGFGISMFLKKTLPPRSAWVSAGPVTKSQEKLLKQDHPGVKERFWWQLDKGQLIPVGLVLIFDGRPTPGHCRLTVQREMTVRGFLSLVSMIRFTPKGSDLIG